MFIPFGFMAGEVASAGYLLDDYGSATVAYSLRKLSSSSTNAVEVRRSSDNATLDVGFSGEDLDTASLLSWAGTDTVYVTKWYDQSGNSNDAIQTTTTAQPIIAESSAMQTVNGKSAMNFDGTSDYFDFTSNVATSNTTAWSWVFNRATAGIKQSTLAQTGASTPYAPYWYSDNVIYYAPTTGGGNGLASGLTGQVHLFNDAVSGTFTITLNGSGIGNNTYLFAATNYTTLGRRAAEYTIGKYQELILWNSDQSSNQSGIESNTNTYYSIYP